MEDKMILYCLDNQCFLYPLLMHRLSINKKEKAVLLIDKGMRINKYLKSLTSFGLFDDVIEVTLLYNNRNSKNANEVDYINWFDGIFSKLKYKLYSFDDICVLNDYWDGDINLYLNLKKLNYTWIQTVVNLIAYKPQYVSDEFAEMMLKYKAHTPFAQFAHPYILKTSDKSIIELKDKGFKLWDMDESCNNLSEYELDAIAACYGFKIDEFDAGKAEKCALIVLNSYGYGLRSLVEYKYKSEYLKHVLGFEKNIDFKSTDYPPISSVMTRLAMDFYIPNFDKYYIKLHPNDTELTSEQIHYFYGDSAEVFTSMPFELLNRLLSYKNIKFGALMTYAHKINDFNSDKLIVLGDKYRYTWFFYCSLYISVLYAQKCGFDEIRCSVDIKDQVQFISNLLKYNLAINDINYSYAGKIHGVKRALFLCNILDVDNGLIEPLIKNVDKTSAICFLNIGLNNFFFSRNDVSNFFALKIQKVAQNEKTFFMEREETLWIYSENRDYRGKALGFKFEKNMLHSGYILKVNQSNVFESDRQFMELSSLSVIRMLEYKLLRSECIIKTLTKSSNEAYITKSLVQCNDLFTYVQLLGLVKNKYIIALAVKDTPGDNLTEEDVCEIRSLGFSNFTAVLWHTYVGIIDKGVVVCNLVNDIREEPVCYEGQDINNILKFKITSMAWRRGNKAEIKIGDVDYSVNMRGLNFVVFDVDNNKVIDSVAFDYHMEHKCYRK